MSSINLPTAWASRTIRSPSTAESVARTLRDAMQTQRRVIVLVSKKLTKDGKGWLVRCTSGELLCLELSPRHLVGLGISDGGICTVNHPSPDHPTDHQVIDLGLSEVSIENPERLRADRSTVGYCRIEHRGSSPDILENAALRAEFFHPELLSPISVYSKFQKPIQPGVSQRRFKFRSIVSDWTPRAPQGTFVIFFQVVTALDWANLDSVYPISNPSAMIVKLRSRKSML